MRVDNVDEVTDTSRRVVRTIQMNMDAAGLVGESPVVSTASPFKFCDSVLDALGIKEHKGGLDILDQLAEVTGEPVPVPLARLKNRRHRFEGVVKKDAMKDCVLEFLK